MSAHSYTLNWLKSADSAFFSAEFDAEAVERFLDRYGQNAALFADLRDAVSAEDWRTARYQWHRIRASWSRTPPRERLSSHLWLIQNGYVEPPAEPSDPVIMEARA